MRKTHTTFNLRYLLPIGTVFLTAILFLWACQKSTDAPSLSANGKTAVKAINTPSDFQKAMQSSHNKLAVIDFYADWCGPCRDLAPLLEKIAREMDQEAQFYKVNIDEQRQLAMQSGVSGIPYVTFFKNGKKVHSLMGVWPEKAYIREVTRFAFPVKEAFETDTPDGDLVDGIRVIHLGPDYRLEDIYVYRGETVKLVYKDLKAAYSVAIPKYQISKDGRLGEDLEVNFKASEVGVFPIFCNGDCPSGDGMGYGRIVVMPFTGANEGIFEELDAKQAKEFIDANEALILDVRTPNEYYDGHLPQAKLIPVQQLNQRISEISDHKEKKILVYCRSGNRSTVASEILIHHGFKKIYHLKNGINGWMRAGYALKK